VVLFALWLLDPQRYFLPVTLLGVRLKHALSVLIVPFFRDQHNFRHFSFFCHRFGFFTFCF